MFKWFTNLINKVPSSAPSSFPLSINIPEGASIGSFFINSFRIQPCDEFEYREILNQIRSDYIEFTDKIFGNADIVYLTFGWRAYQDRGFTFDGPCGFRKILPNEFEMELPPDWPKEAKRFGLAPEDIRRCKTSRDASILSIISGPRNMLQDFIRSSKGGIRLPLTIEIAIDARTDSFDVSYESRR